MQCNAVHTKAFIKSRVTCYSGAHKGRVYIVCLTLPKRIFTFGRHRINCFNSNNYDEQNNLHTRTFCCITFHFIRFVTPTDGFIGLHCGKRYNNTFYLCDCAHLHRFSPHFAVSAFKFDLNMRQYRVAGTCYSNICMKLIGVRPIPRKLLV